VPAKRLKEYLDSNNVPYVTISHSVAYTAQAIAALTHISGNELAKTVIINRDGVLAMAVLPASQQIDLAALRSASGATTLRLAIEGEFQQRFPECETGAMPPFGNLYDMQVFVDERLTKDKEIAFNAGSHRELIRLAYEDFARLVKPIVATFARGARATAA
jgi:Ala-tRNA(Pro) deacylase